MGIYDARWLNDNFIVTCSADNTIKTWSVSAEGALESKDTFIQKEGPRDTNLQLLGFGANTNDKLSAVNLSGDLVHFCGFTAAQDKNPSSIRKGHQGLISDIVNVEKHMLYGSENRVFYFNEEAAHDVNVIEGTPNKQAILELFANGHSVYATTLDKFVLRFTIGEGVTFAKSLDLKTAASKGIGCADDVLYVLKSNGELEEVDALELTVKRSHKLAFEATTITYSSVTKELWVGDKKGILHVLSTADFSEVHAIEKHSKAVTCITVSPDGSQIASGDAYRYQYTWDASTRAMVGEYGFQKDKITSLRYNKAGDQLASTSTDLSLGIVNTVTGISKVKKNPHSVKPVSHAVFNSNGDVMTTGDDCVIRIWKGF